MQRPPARFEAGPAPPPHYLAYDARIGARAFTRPSLMCPQLDMYQEL